MSVAALAFNEYMSVSRETLNPRAVEYQVFSRITNRLEQTKTDNDPLRKNLIEALYENGQLWSYIAADVSSDENGLPKDLRGRLFYLSEFMRVQTSRILNKESDVQAIIDINRAIMEGLRTNITTTQKG